MKKRSLIIFILMIILFSLSFKILVVNNEPAEEKWEWKTSTPEKQGIDSEKLIKFFKHIEKENLNLSSLLIIRNGRLVTEVYSAPYNQDTVHNLYSCTKSLLSSLVGIALEEGYLKSVDQKLVDFFPEYYTEEMDPWIKEITLEDLLTMSAGYKIGSWSNQNKIFTSDNSVKQAMKRSLVNPPGDKFAYDNVSSHLIGAILVKATGMSLLDFAQQHLFTPLGIQEVRWAKLVDGRYMGFSGVYLTPRQMAKFGLLFLNNGYWQGKEVVPKEWVEKSTRAYKEIALASSWKYGYQWWRQGKVYFAKGFGWQRIMVYPKLDMVVVTTAEEKETPALDSLLLDSIPAAVKDNQPLEPNPEANEKLAKMIEKFQNPASKEVSPLPKKAAEISGKTYQLQENNLGIQTMRFDFSGEDIAYLSLNRQIIKIGLDGTYRKSDYNPSYSFYPVNKAAAKGEWTRDELFYFNLNLIGETEYEWEVEFKDNKIVVYLYKLDASGFYDDTHTIIKGKIRD